MNIEDFKFRSKAKHKYIQEHPISQEQALLWMYCSMRQAEQLTRDALVLHRRGRNATACGILLLGLEELSKPKILLEYISKPPHTQATWAIAKKKLLSHPDKISGALGWLLNSLKTLSPATYPKHADTFKNFPFDAIQEMANVRELSFYTSAWSDGVHSPGNLSNQSKKLLGVSTLVLTTSKNYKAFLKKNSPVLFRKMENVFLSKTERTLNLRHRDYRKEVKKYVYLLKFIKTYFDDSKYAMTEIVRRGEVQRLANLLTSSRYKRKIKIAFEVLKKTPAVNDKLRIEMLHEENIKRASQNLFKHLSEKGLLVKK